MSGAVLSFARAAPQPRDWSNQELAEFYRVEASLIRAGLAVDTERGLSDEGDPWFVFCAPETGDVVIHFARIDNEYVVASPAFESCLRGRDFRTLINRLTDSHPLVMPKSRESGKLSIHPAALLVALVMTCFFKLGHSEAVAGELRVNTPTPHAPGLVPWHESSSATQGVVVDDQTASTVLAAIAAAVAIYQAEFATVLNAPASVSTSHVVLESSATAPFPLVFDASALPSFQASSSSAANGALVASLDTSALSASMFVFMHALESGSTLMATPHMAGVATASTANFNAASTASDSAPAIASHSLAPAFVIGAFELAAANVSADGHASAPLSLALIEVGALLGAGVQSHLVVNVVDPNEQAVLATIESSPVQPVTEQTASYYSGADQSAAPDMPTSGSLLLKTTSSDGVSTGAVAPAIDLSTTTSHTTTATSPATTSAPTVDSTSTPSVDSTPAAAPISAPTPSAASALATELAAATTAIEQFISVHPDFQLIDSGSEVIFYDPHLTPTNLPTATQESFLFPDGSSVYLIGLPAHSATASA